MKRDWIGKWWVKAAAAALVALAVPTAAYATGQVVRGNVVMNLAFTESVTTGVLATNNIPVPVSQSLAYSNGTGALAVDTIYGKQLTLVASTPQTLDLTSLVDPSGTTVNFARVREFTVQVVTATAGFSVAVSRGASNGWSFLPASTSAIAVQPNGGALSIRDPNSTGASTGLFVGGSSKTILLDPGSNTVIINIIIVGGSAAFVVLPFGLRRYRKLRAAA